MYNIIDNDAYNSINYINKLQYHVYDKPEIWFYPYQLYLYR